MDGIGHVALLLQGAGVKQEHAARLVNHHIRDCGMHRQGHTAKPVLLQRH
jgi:hypothetical protein